MTTLLSALEIEYVADNAKIADAIERRRHSLVVVDSRNFRGNNLRIIGNPEQVVEFDALVIARFIPQQNTIEKGEFLGVPVAITTFIIVEQSNSLLQMVGLVLYFVTLAIESDFFTHLPTY